MNDWITWGSWRGSARRLDWRPGWMNKTRLIENRVSVGTATAATILNGLGFSNRQLYLVPQYFANKPVEHLLGTGISADMLDDDCRDCESRPIDLWSQNRLSACGRQLVFRE